MEKNTSKKDVKDAKNIKDKKDVEKELIATINLEELQQELADSQNSGKQSYDKLLRVQAEIENLRKRNTKDLENAHKFALDNFAKSLLEVADSIVMGIKTANEDNITIKSIKDGMEMTNKIFLDTLEKFNIKQINPNNSSSDKFSPEQHEAITMVPNPDIDSNNVIEVIQVGFSLNDRVIRPAMVIVSA